MVDPPLIFISRPKIVIFNETSNIMLLIIILNSSLLM